MGDKGETGKQKQGEGWRGEGEREVEEKSINNREERRLKNIL